MSDKSTRSPPTNPADIAREAFRQLALRKIAPTPDAYRDTYDKIAGYAHQPVPEEVFGEFATSLLDSPDGLTAIATMLQQAATTGYWPDYAKGLTLLVEQLRSGRTGGSSVFEDDPRTALLRNLLMRTLTLAVASLLQGVPALAQEAETLGRVIKDARSQHALDDASAKLKQLCFKIELKSGDLAEQHALLMSLFRLLLENVSNLLDKDAWIHGQIAAVQQLIDGPIDDIALRDVMRSLKDVIYKQSVLKDSLTEAQDSIRDMMENFLASLEEIAHSTDSYHRKIADYSLQIEHTADTRQVGLILGEVLKETQTARDEAMRSRDVILSTRRTVAEAEERIRSLEGQLQEMSEMVREDHLTGSLNRRGLDDVFDREITRGQYGTSPLCIALLDLDDFKKINDQYGHTTGDEALIHLVRVIKDTLRAMDVIGRFGGEEFLIILPNTDMDEAMLTITRLQRELTRQIFMHKHMRLLMTFSAGLAQLREGEDRESLIKRADMALYAAKKAGKNRVIAAD